MDRKYIKYYFNQAGGNVNEIGHLLQAYPAIQRGQGLGSLFASLFRFLKPAVASGLNLLKDEALKTGANILSDLAYGGNPKEIFQDQTKAAIKNLRANAVNQLHSMYGSGKKRKPIKRRAKSKTKSIAKGRTKTRRLTRKKKSRILDTFN